jgi:hypothetical protein
MERKEVCWWCDIQWFRRDTTEMTPWRQKESVVAKFGRIVVNGGQDSQSGPMWFKMRQYRGMGTGEDKGNLSRETALGGKKQNFPSVVTPDGVLRLPYSCV